MAHGKSIHIFLIEGEPSGRWMCELSNWNGIAFKIPRSMIPKCSDRVELQKPGVYFFVGKTEDQYSDKIYIGESECLMDRFYQHKFKGDKEWQDWSDWIVFTSKDDHLNKAMVRYLEGSLYELAVKAGRCEVNNAVRPTKSVLSEPDTAEMEEYLDNLRLIMGTMGYKFLEPSLTKQQKKDSVTYHAKSTKTGYDAKGTIVEDGFVVFKGSKISDVVADSFKDKAYNALRQRLIEDGSIKDLVFTKDVLFSSYSAASSVVMGHNSNGWLDWKDLQGRTINDNLNAEE